MEMFKYMKPQKRKKNQNPQQIYTNSSGVDLLPYTN